MFFKARYSPDAGTMFQLGPMIMPLTYKSFTSCSFSWSTPENSALRKKANELGFIV